MNYDLSIKVNSYSNIFASFKPILGILTVVISQILFSLLSCCAKKLYIDTNITTFELVYARSLVMISCLCFQSEISNQSALKVEFNIIPFLIPRMIFGYLAHIFYFLQFQFLPMSIAIIVMNLTPFFTSIFAYFILSEKLTQFDLIGLFFSFFGVILIGKDSSNSQSEYHFIYLGIPILVAMFGSLADIFAKKVTVLSNNIFISPFFFCILPLFFSPSFLLFGYYGHITDYSLKTIFLSFLIGICGWMGTTLLTIALKLEKAGRVAIFQYSGIIFSMILDIFYFQRIFTFVEIIGGIFIIGTNVILTYMKINNIIQ